MKYYDCSQIQKLIGKYTENGGQMFQIREGSLGYGDLLLYDDGDNLRTFVIHEIFQNCWSSVHTVRGYNKMPGKYRKMLENAGLI